MTDEPSFEDTWPMYAALSAGLSPARQDDLRAHFKNGPCWIFEMWSGVKSDDPDSFRTGVSFTFSGGDSLLRSKAFSKDFRCELLGLAVAENLTVEVSAEVIDTTFKPSPKPSELY